MGNTLDSLHVGERLASLRSDYGLSQSEFATRLAISLRAYQTYERGERELPFPVALRLNSEFGISPVWLGLGEAASQMNHLSADRAALLCSELYEQWQQGVDGLPIALSFDVKKVLFRKFARAAFRDQAVPSLEIAETIRDLTP